MNNIKTEREVMEKAMTVIVALNHPTRLHILTLLMERSPMRVLEMRAALRISKTNFSNHLTVLKECKLIERVRREAKGIKGDARAASVRVHRDRVESALKAANLLCAIALL